MNLLELKSQITPDLSRAPSFYNWQPYRIRFHHDEIFVIDDTERMLTHLDPSERLHEIGVGMFIEALNVVLSTVGLKISRMTFHKESLVSMRIRAKIRVEPSSEVDPLATYLPQLDAYYGKFEALSSAEERKHLAAIKKIAGVQVLATGAAKTKWAQISDQETMKLLDQKPSRDELLSLLRFSSNHPKYAVDGLNSSALGLNWLQSKIADELFQSQRVDLVDKVGLVKTLLSEGKQIESSLALVAIVSEANAPLIEQGRGFLRRWLELTKLGLTAAPMPTLKTVEGLKAEQVLVGVLRVGSLGTKKRVLSPRIRSIEA